MMASDCRQPDVESARNWPAGMRHRIENLGGRFRIGNLKGTVSAIVAASSLGLNSLGCLCLDELVPDCVAHQVRGRPQLQLAHGAGAMRLDGLDADAQPLRDFLVDAPFGDLLDDFALAMREAARQGCGLLSRNWSRSVSEIAPEK